MYLLDTMVLSELRKARRNVGVVAWVRSVPPQDIFVSSVTVAEIERGIERQRATDPPFAAELVAWLDRILRAYGERILPLDVRAGRRWGRLSAQLGNRSWDLAIAAIALEHGLTMVTRNVADFVPTGVSVINPFSPD